MFDFVADVGGGDVVVEALGVVFDDDFAFALALVFPLYKLLFDGVVPERLHERTELLLLVVSSRTSRVHEYRRTYHCRKHFRFLELPLVDVKHNQQVKVHSFVVVGRRAKLYG